MSELFKKFRGMTTVRQTEKVSAVLPWQRKALPAHAAVGNARIRQKLANLRTTVKAKKEGE